jgi:putative transposase
VTAIGAGDRVDVHRADGCPEAAGLSPTTITRLTAAWEVEHTAFRQRDLSDRDDVYVWVDGVHFTIRLGDERLCALVVIGVRADGVKEGIAVEDGYRESTESWLTLLRDLKRRGMTAPVVAVGDGALGFWNAVGEAWPETREQRCWVHRLATVLDKLPQRLQPKAKRALHEIMNAATRGDAEVAITAFTAEYQAKSPKAVASLDRDQEKLLTFFDFPAEHWHHWRTTNPVESPFSTVRLRQRVTKGAGPRMKGLVMAYKLLVMAEARWRKLNAPHLLPVGPENLSQPQPGRLVSVSLRRLPLIVMMQPTHFWHFPDRANLRPLNQPRHGTIHR